MSRLTLQDPWLYTTIVVTGGLLLGFELLPRVFSWLWRLGERNDPDE